MCTCTRSPPCERERPVLRVMGRRLCGVSRGSQRNVIFRSRKTADSTSHAARVGPRRRDLMESWTGVVGSWRGAPAAPGSGVRAGLSVITRTHTLKNHTHHTQSRDPGEVTVAVLYSTIPGNVEPTSFCSLVTVAEKRYSNPQVHAHVSLFCVQCVTRSSVLLSPYGGPWHKPKAEARFAGC